MMQTSSNPESKREENHTLPELMTAIVELLRQQNQAIQQQNQMLQQQMALLSRAQNREEDAEVEQDDEFQPFSKEILFTKVPENLKMPVMESYAGRGDPNLHLAAFRAQMLIYNANDALKCKIFPATLKETALMWFTRLPFQSINSFAELAKKFVAQFAANCSRKMFAAYLYDIRQGQGETLRAYLGRFNNEVIWVVDPDENISMAAFRKGLRAGPFKESLEHQPAFDMDEIRARGECFIESDEIDGRKRAQSIRLVPGVDI